MLSEELFECTETANSIASRKNAEETAKERDLRENEFINQYQKLTDQIDTIYEMDKIFPVNMKEADLFAVKSGFETGLGVFKKAVLPKNPKAPESVRNALVMLESKKKKWINSYKVSEELMELKRMLTLAAPVYKGTPGVNELSKKIDRILEVPAVDKATVVTAGDAIQTARSIIDGMEIDDDVTTFLKKVSSGNAKLADLNEPVMRWLQENNLLGKISISIQ